MKNYISCNQERVEVTISLSDTVDLRTRNVVGDKKEHCVIMGPVLQEDYLTIELQIT